MQPNSLTCSSPIRPAACCVRLEHAQCVGPHRRHRSCVATRAVEPQAAEKSGADQAIEGLNSTFCDEFVCTSSPAVESSVRQLAKDLQRANGVWTPIYTTNVVYQDPFRKFKGPAGFQRLDFVPTNVQRAAVDITSMRMLDNSAAEIRWRLTGSLGPLSLDVAGTTTVSMNLLTGRIEKQQEQWDLSRCSPPAAAAWNVARAVWAAKQMSTDAGNTANRVLDTLTTIDDEDTFTERDTQDPLKFFQQKDTFKQDALFLGGVLLLFYVLVQSWTNLFTSGGGGGGGGGF